MEFYEMDDAELEAYREQRDFEEYQASAAAEFHGRIEEAKKLAVSYPRDQKVQDAQEFLTRYAARTKKQDVIDARNAAHFAMPVRAFGKDAVNNRRH